MKHNPNSFKYICILIAFLLFAAAANAQTGTLTIQKTDTAQLVRQIQAELMKEVPVYFLCGSDQKRSSHQLYYVKGFQKAGMNLDSRKRPLPEWVIVFAILPRTIKTK